MGQALDLSGGESQLLPLAASKSEGGDSPGLPGNGLFEAKSFGDYELLEELGRGGMGVVYRARQVSLNRSVAVKLILSGKFASRQEVLRFRGEAEAAANLRHPSIVAIYETGEIQGQNYFSMEYVQGRTLAEIVRDNPLAPERAARYVRIVAEAIQYAHGQGILHRDLKPSNVLVDADDQPRVTDFGLARRLRGEFGITVTGQVLGSPSFMPPEQTSGKQARVGPTADVYGLGAILYHLLTSRPPFQAETIEEVLQQLHERDPVPPRLLNASVPRDLETICLKCLAKEPDKRFPTALALAEELGRVERDEPIHSRPASWFEKAWRWCRRKPALAAAIGAALSLLLIVAVGSPVALLRISAARSESERNLYVDNIHLANDALEAHDLARARLLLAEIDKSPIQRGMRGWEWRYLAGRCRGDELATLYRSASPIPGLAASRDGKWLATIGEDGQVKLWDFATRRAANAWLAHAGESKLPDFFSHGLAFALSGDELFTVGSDKCLRCWEVPSGKKRAEIVLSEAANQLAVSQDGALLAIGTTEGRLSLFNLSQASPTLLSTWASDLEVLVNLRFSIDGLSLFVGSAPGQAVQHYDLTEPSTPRRLSDLEDSAGPLAVSPDGHWLATAQSDGQRVCLRSLPSLRPVATNFEAVAESQVSVLEFSPDAQVLATGLKSGRIILRKIGKSNSEAVTLLGHEGCVAGLVFSRDGHTLASADYMGRTVRLWDPTVRERSSRVFPQEGTGHEVDFAPDSKRLVSISGSSARLGTNRLERVAIVRLWSVEEGQGLILLASATNRAFGLNFSTRFSTDGRMVAVDDYATNRFLEVPTLKPIANAGQHLACFGRDHGRLFYVDGDTIIRSETTLATSSPLIRQKGEIIALALSPDGRTLASCALDEDYVLKLWDATTGQNLAVLPGHEARVNCLAFSADGKTLASAGWDDGYLGFWDVPQGRKRALLRSHNGAVFKVAFSPDGATLATCGDDALLRLWNAAQQREVAVLPTHGGAVSGMAFSPDGHWLACASNDGAIHLWWAPSLSEIEPRGQVDPRP